MKLPAPLRPYQIDGVAFLSTRNAALLADEMGLGKTVQTAVALRRLSDQRDMNRALVVCPASLKRNWVQELRRWVPELYAQEVIGDAADRNATYMLPIPILVASYEQIRLDREFLSNGTTFDVVVVDEAQRIKNSDSDASLACRVIPRQRSWALTGTPLENRPEDLVSIFHFLQSGLLSSGMESDDIQAAMRPHFLRRRKKDVLTELPPILEQCIALRMTGAQAVAYEELWEQRRTYMGAHGWSSGNLLALITRLKQLCNYEPLTGSSVKMEALRTLLDGNAAGGEKTVVFSQYVETLRWIRERLEMRSFLYHGGMALDERHASLESFRSESGTAVLLMSLKAGGVGLNIPEADLVVLFDRWWNPAVEDQAIQRAHRLGRTAPLHSVRFVVSESIEGRIVEVINEKLDLFDTLVEQAENAEVDESAASVLAYVLDMV